MTLYCNVGFWYIMDEFKFFTSVFLFSRMLIRTKEVWTYGVREDSWTDIVNGWIIRDLLFLPISTIESRVS